jgi:hypothetical protein
LRRERLAAERSGNFPRDRRAQRVGFAYAQAKLVQEHSGTFDDNQRAQIGQIVSYVQTRAAATSYVMDSARQAMLAAQTDDKAVREIHSHMESTLAQLDAHGITPPGTGVPLKGGDFVMKNGVLYEVAIEKGKPMGTPVVIK